MCGIASGHFAQRCGNSIILLIIQDVFKKALLLSLMLPSLRHKKGIINETKIIIVVKISFGCSPDFIITAAENLIIIS